MDSQELRPIHDQINGLFRITLSDREAVLNYRIKDHSMYFMHTEVPEEFKGKGFAGSLIQSALQFALNSSFKIALLCPFSRAYVVRHSEWQKILDRGFHKSGL